MTKEKKIRIEKAVFAYIEHHGEGWQDVLTFDAIKSSAPKQKREKLLNYMLSVGEKLIESGQIEY